MTYASQMMIIVLAHEIKPINNSHRRLKPGVKRRPARFFFIELFESLNQCGPFAPEFGEYMLHRVGIMKCLECFPVGYIGGGEHFLPCLKIVEPGYIDIFKIEQVTRVFLD